MGIMIIPGGCRRSENGRAQRSDCNTCVRQDACEMEPYARELAEIMTHQWVSVTEQAPPEHTSLLYLEYPGEERGGTVRHGYFDGIRYTECASGESLPASAVIAWMLIPQVPAEIYPAWERARPVRARDLGKPWESSGL